MLRILKVCLIIVALTLTPSDCTEFLPEKPAYMESCRMEQTNFNECIRKVFTHIYTTWANGIESLPGSQTIDPLFVKEMAFLQDERGASNVPSMSVTMHNLTVSGMSTNKMKAARKSSTSSDDVYHLRIENFTPNTRIVANYSAMGSLMLLQINAQGAAFFDIMNGRYTVRSRLRLASRDNRTFFEVSGLHFRVNDIESVHLNFENLFRDKMLSESTNAVFNENWRMFYEIFKTKIEEVIGKVLYEHFRNVFERVPADYFVAGLKSAQPIG